MTKRFKGDSTDENENENEQEFGNVVIKYLVDSNRFTSIGQHSDSIHRYYSSRIGDCSRFFHHSKSLSKGSIYRI